MNFMMYANTIHFNDLSDYVRIYPAVTCLPFTQLAERWGLAASAQLVRVAHGAMEGGGRGELLFGDGERAVESTR